eukprot:3939733-Rhodomonas_salina.1
MTGSCNAGQLCQVCERALARTSKKSGKSDSGHAKKKPFQFGGPAAVARYATRRESVTYADYAGRGG